MIALRVWLEFRMSYLTVRCSLLHFEVDVTDEAAARRAVDEAADSLGGLDAVLNIAACSYWPRSQRGARMSDGRCSM
jgi:NAD(P)-dependent dehydrogenase (short-subunit alcohol dehydrogenase family)